MIHASRRAVLLWAGAGLLAPGAALACDRPGNAGRRRDGMMVRINQRRQSAGLDPLNRAGKLMAAAQGHACWMANNRSLSHVGRNGTRAPRRVRAEGYDWTYVAENVAAGAGRPAEVVAGWMGSPPHRANILARQAREIGVGLARAGGRSYWCLVVAAR